MNEPSLQHHPAGAGSVTGIARLIRRVLVLRELGDLADAARLEAHDLLDAVRDHRLAHGPNALPESELRALYAAETERVANAAIFCELLLPRLVKMLPASGGPVPSAVNRTSVRPTTPVASASAAPTGSPAIPDLLDAMLAAERSGRRPVTAGKHES